MVHAAANLSPEFQGLKQELVDSLSDAELALAKRRFEKDFKGKFTGTNFDNFDNFLNRFWADGIVQHLLLPEKSEIGQFKKANPESVKVLKKIEKLFKTPPKEQ